MIEYRVGNILASDTKALVNTVNCEGYMGKGIAYQFKTQFPLNNQAYVKACKTGEIKIGKVFSFEEDGKIILNFPTKNHWREKSRYEYIESGLLSLKYSILKQDIKSVSIPPLGCGNGGLIWDRVKGMIFSSLQNLNDIKIVIYEPSENISNELKVKSLPKLNASHLLLMQLKINLEKFNKTRLQKSAFLLNYLSKQEYFKFEAHNFGPFAYSLEILSKDIKEYQLYYGFDTEQAYLHARTVLISESVLNKESFYLPFLKKATSFVNKISTDKELELLTTILFIIKNSYPIKENEIVASFKNWSDHKAQFPEKDIQKEIEKLLSIGFVNKQLYGLFPIA